MFAVDTYVSEDRIALWKGLSCLHFVNRETAKFCERTRKSSLRAITLDDGSRVMQPELHRRLEALCIQMFAEMPVLGDARRGYAFALSDTNLQRRLREALKTGGSDILSPLVQTMDAVIAYLDTSSDRLVHGESLTRLKALRNGFFRLIPSR